MKMTTRIMGGILTGTVFFLLLTSCGKKKPSVAVADPREYVIDRLDEAELHTWWEVYRNRDRDFLGGIVDEEAKRLSNGLPGDSRSLDRLTKKLVMFFSIASTKSEAQRELIFQKAQARLESPPIALYEPKARQGTHTPKIALLDYDYLPGKWTKPIRRGPMKMGDCAAVQADFSITDATFLKAMKQLEAAFPKAEYFQIRCHYYHGDFGHSLLYQIPSYGVVMVRADSQMRFSSSSVKRADLVAGLTKLSDLAWHLPNQDNPGPFLFSPDKEPLKK